MNLRRKTLLLVTALALLLLSAGAAYISDFYKADADAVAAMASTGEITVTADENRVVFFPAQPEAGFIFYPGGKVEHTAYAPLMQALARENILCVLVEMPGNLAVLDTDAAAEVPPLFPEIETWYIGGHSLGGSMAASWAAEHTDAVDGLALLAAYSTADLTDTGLKVLSVDGTEDGVLNREKQAQYAVNLPENAQIINIPGGNHGQFGSYGHQDGDGIASISPEEQIAITTDALTCWMKEP